MCRTTKNAFEPIDFSLLITREVQVRELISKLSEEKNSAIQQNKRLHQELHVYCSHNFSEAKIGLAAGVTAFLCLYTCIIGFKPAKVNITSELPLGSGCVNLDLNNKGWFMFVDSELELELLKRESSRSRDGISLMYVILIGSLSKIDLENMVRSGNVTFDVARLLLRPTMELATTDIASSVLAALNESSIRKVYLVGRRGPVQAACTAKELLEILGIKDLYIHIRNVDLLTTSSSSSDEGQSIYSHFSRFGICKFGPSCKYDHSVTNDILASSNGYDQGRPFQFNCFGDEYGEWEVEQMRSVW
ncbi:hypothetical protein POM88_052345 [Heracleum sosnowskyi]|uniref:C3H1-type domain-containing protein n=1 Tax=Heracleum sosnowskyi TaxID=360622 RepID=A0AAD8GQH3_9APIA|nr:hypothetical protein POM88_052345 [Heracleum sosnowskyi]